MSSIDRFRGMPEEERLAALKSLSDEQRAEISSLISSLAMGKAAEAQLSIAVDGPEDPTQVSELNAYLQALEDIETGVFGEDS